MTIDVFNIIDMHIISISITAVILVTSLYNGDTKTIQQKMFIIMLVVFIMAVLTEMVTYIVGSDLYFIAYWGNSLSYMLSPITPYFWAMYVFATVKTDNSKFVKFALIAAIPAVINIIFLLLNPITHLNFTLTSNLIFARGPLFYYVVSVAIIYMIIAGVLILKNKEIIGKSYTINLLVFEMMPIVGTVGQVLFYGTLVLWMCITIATVILFINIQNKIIYIDFLTKVDNRRSLMQYLSSRIGGRENKSFSAFMVDIDRFKNINDNFGHQQGDEALKRTVIILRKVFTNKAFICRYGGDEFIVVTPNIYSAECAIEVLDEELEKFNMKSKTFKLSFSIGEVLYDKNSNIHVDELIKSLDEEMYNAKSAKNFSRRSTDQ